MSIPNGSSCAKNRDYRSSRKIRQTAISVIGHLQAMTPGTCDVCLLHCRLHAQLMKPAPLSHLEKLCQDETWPILICKTVFNPQSVQAGDYLISTSPAHCEFMHFDEPTPLTGVYTAVRIFKTKPRQKFKAAKRQRQRDSKRRTIAEALK